MIDVMGIDEKIKYATIHSNYQNYDINDEMKYEKAFYWLDVLTKLLQLKKD